MERRPTLARKHPRLVLAVAAVALVVLGVALAAFQPWRLFTSTTVREVIPAAPAPAAASPSATGTGTVGPSTSVPVSPAAPEVLGEGSFVSHEHRTTGRVRVLRLVDGSRVLRLEDLATSDGPALHVWLSDQPVREGRAGWHVFDDGAYVDLGDLKGNRGDQNYPVPPDVDLQGLTSVSVWCARFHVSFGAATLTPAA